ncbi:MAG: ORF6N domain-containing protein [bacterium]|nr:ORF6N domain-containing protein [bacterium]
MRDQKIILDADLALLYGVETKALNRAVRRNIKRFPADFVFRISPVEFEGLKCRIGTSSWGGRRYLPYAFSEHGAIMAATVLNSKRAVEMSVFVVRAFVYLRNLLASNGELASKVAEHDRKLATHDKYILAIVNAIKKQKEEPASRKAKIGFNPERN